jgi:hypothetical protein
MTVTQAQFRRAILSPDHPVPDGLVDGQSAPAGKRFSVYRNNVVVSLTEALATGFPVIAKLLGPNNFQAVMGEFLRAHPPRSPLMMHYGAALPDFLQTFPPLAHLPYLPDVARLELALRTAYHAADADPMSPDLLDRFSPDAMLVAQFQLAPATTVLQSPWPIYAIWQFNMNDGPNPTATAQDVLITRPDFDPEITLLAPGAAAFIAALQQGQSLGNALQAATQSNDTFDLGATLGLLLAKQALIAIQPEVSK